IYQNLLIAPCWNIVRAYDLLTGEQRWEFHMIPWEGEPFHETWSVPGYGANTWGGMALDAVRGIAYVSTGSPHPNYLGMLHTGDNLYANSVVALKADTGERLWHFQEIPHDIWDLDIPAPPNLVTVTRDGKRYDAVAQVTKLGNTLLLDRVTGKPLFPFRRRRAPVSGLEGEVTAPWQPDLELPEPFAPREFSLDDVTDISSKSRDFVMSKIAGADFGWFRPFRAGTPLVFYGMHGGAEWPGASFDPESGWLYVSANKLPWVVKIDRVKLPAWTSPSARTNGERTYLQYCSGCHGAARDGRESGPQLFTPAMRSARAQLPGIIRNGRGAMPPIRMPEEKIAELLDYIFGTDRPAAAQEQSEDRYSYGFAGYSKLLDDEDRPGVKPPWGTLNAINLNTGKIEWRVPLGEYEDLTARGIPKTGAENFGGSTVTAGGLVFCGGTRDLKLRAFDSKTGKELWEYKLPFGGFAPAAVFEAQGRQFVLIAATGGGKVGTPTGDVWMAFALPGGQAAPAKLSRVQRSSSH
ncbi:MAG: c-type cytochrome, partial [Acidobacteriales bacterium]|nr:c-type cytochrome [Terriglobales bacterium]